VERALGNLAGKRITVLGLAYKPNVDDLRESPAIETALLLAKAGAVVTAFEPFKTDFQQPEFKTKPTLELALADADAVLLLVAHTDLCNLDPKTIAEMTSARVAIDTINGWDPAVWQQAGFQLFRLGVRKD
jgi:UDP-N-acetyl-D-mannosaminuronate dehydrogenase